MFTHGNTDDGDQHAPRQTPWIENTNDSSQDPRSQPSCPHPVSRHVTISQSSSDHPHAVSSSNRVERPHSVNVKPQTLSTQKAFQFNHQQYPMAIPRCHGDNVRPWWMVPHNAENKLTTPHNAQCIHGSRPFGALGLIPFTMVNDQNINGQIHPRRPLPNQVKPEVQANISESDFHVPPISLFSPAVFRAPLHAIQEGISPRFPSHHGNPYANELFHNPLVHRDQSPNCASMPSPPSYPSNAVVYSPLLPNGMMRNQEYKCYPAQSVHVNGLMYPPRFQFCPGAPPTSFTFPQAVLPPPSIYSPAQTTSGSSISGQSESQSSAFGNLQRWAHDVLSRIDAPLSVKDLNAFEPVNVLAQNPGECMSHMRPNSIDSGIGSSFSRSNTPTDAKFDRQNFNPIHSSNHTTRTESLRNINERCKTSEINFQTMKPFTGAKLAKRRGGKPNKRKPRKKKTHLKAKCSERTEASSSNNIEENIRISRKRRRMVKNKINTLCKKSLVKNACESSNAISSNSRQHSFHYPFMYPYMCENDTMRSYSTNKTRRRKQERPRKSPPFQEGGFRGVTLKMQTVVTAEADTYLSVQAFFSSRRLQKLHEKHNRQRVLAFYRPHSCHSHGKLLHQAYSHFKTPPSTQGGSKQCASCLARRTPLWRDAEDGTPLCNACGIRYKKYRVRCLHCSFIPRKEGKSVQRCLRCGSPLKLPSLRPKIW